MYSLKHPWAQGDRVARVDQMDPDIKEKQNREGVFIFKQVKGPELLTTLPVFSDWCFPHLISFGTW